MFKNLKSTHSLRIAATVIIACITIAIAVSMSSFLVSATEKTDNSGDRLLGIAQEKGAARIIVGLRLAKPFAPEGELTDDAVVEQQRAEIRSAQINLLGQLANFRVTDLKQFEFIPFVAFETDAVGIAYLRNLPDVTSIVEDEYFAPTLAESVPLIGGVNAWAAQASGQGWTVAILDTGVDKNHPFLTGKVVSEACYSTNDSANGIFSLCPGGVTATTASNSALPCNGVFGCFHGTHVAGIAAGRNGENGIDGVARDANIIAIQVFSRVQDCPNPGVSCLRTQSSDYINALERVYALRNTYNIAAVNMSFGGGLYSTNCDASFLAIKAAIDNLRSVKIASVISSGNDDSTNSLSAPACISTAVSVGSTEDGSGPFSIDTVSGFSNSSPSLDLLAPGDSIRSSVLGGLYAEEAGTSMSAPHVAGAWAALRERVPNASVTETLSSLVQTGIPITDTRNGVNRVKPRIQIDDALNGLICSNAAAIPIAVNQPLSGSLNSFDCLQNGRRRQIYKFDGTAAQQVRVTLDSNTFDTDLYLYDSAGALLMNNDDFGSGTDSRILPTGYFALPATATYYIAATSKNLGSIGSFQILLEENTTNLPTNGKIAFQSDRDGNDEIYTMNADGSGQTIVSNHPADDRNPIFSPDGRKIVFQSLRDGNPEIYLMNADGSEQVRLTNNSATDEATGFSPDGSRILFQTNRDGNYEIYTMNLNGSSLSRLTNNSALDAEGKYSPDGTQIVFRSTRNLNSEIYRMNANGTLQTRLTTDSSVDENPVFSPDGSRICFDSYRNGNPQIYIMYTDGANVRQITFSVASLRAPTWSPDSSQIAFQSDLNSGQNDVYVVGANGGLATQLTNNGAFDGYPSWQQIPTGIAPPTVTISNAIVTEPQSGSALTTFTVAVQGTITSTVAMNYGTINDTATGPGDFNPIVGGSLSFMTGETSKQITVTINADAIAETTEVFFVKLSNVTNAIVGKSLGTGTIQSQYTGSGKIVFATDRDGNREIYMMNDDGTNATRLTNNSMVDSSPRFSPDGSKIIFDEQIANGDNQLFSMNANGTNLAPITSLTGTKNSQASFSPDNSQVVFSRVASGNLSDIFKIQSNGTGLTQLTTQSSADLDPSFSPDGTQIVFTTLRHKIITNQNSEIYLMKADGSGQTRLTNNTAEDVEPSISPDGRKVVFASSRDGNFEIYTMNIDGTGLRRVTNNTAEDRLPSFSPDGGKILFHSLRTIFTTTQSDIYSIALNGTGETRLTTNAAFDGQASWQGLPAAPTVAINGTVTYGNAIGNPSAPRFVSNVLISGTGSPSVSIFTGGLGASEGQYSLTGFGSGAYTVTPTKTSGVNGAISSFDAARIALHVAGPPNPQLSSTQLSVADVSGNSSVTSFDAAMIAKFVAGPPYATPGIGSTATWRFVPASKTYASVTNSITGEDYSALLMGEVSGNWTNTGARPAESGGPERTVDVELPNMVSAFKEQVVVPVSVRGATNKGVISYEFDLRYDPSVIHPVRDMADVTGTASRGLSVVANATEPGLLRVVVYGAMPLDSDGVLLNLRFTAVGTAGSVSPLSFERIMFNEGEPRVAVTNGKVELSNQ